MSAVVRVPVLSSAPSPSVAHLSAWVADIAGEIGVTPIFAQCEEAVAQDLAAVASYLVPPLDDLAVGMAAHLSARMERPLTGADPELMQDKWEQRTAFALHGVPFPPFALVQTPDEVLACGQRWGYPLILKPVRGTGSRGVCRVDGPTGVAEQLAQARRGHAPPD